MGSEPQVRCCFAARRKPEQIGHGVRFVAVFRMIEARDEPGKFSKTKAS
jgi:hypothetical protein